MKGVPALLCLFMFLAGCIGVPETAGDTERERTGEQRNSTGSQELKERENDPEVLKLERVEPIDPIEIEVVNLGITRNMDYPPFPEINLIPAAVDELGHLTRLLDLRVNNTKFGENPMNLILRPDGTCQEIHQQVIFEGDKVSYQDLFEYRGSYTYDPRTYRMVLELESYREPGESWTSDKGKRVTDYFIINPNGLFDVYFHQQGENWLKQRTEIFQDENPVLYILRGIRVEEEKFTFFQERRKGELAKAEPDYQSARQYAIQGRALDTEGAVYYLEDRILMKNDYIYLYTIPGGVVYRERLGE